MMAQMFTVGRFFTNCYVVRCEQTKETIIIDPGFDDRLEAEKIFKFIEENGSTVRFIVNTHGHPDHTCGNGMAKEKFHAPIMIHEYDTRMLGEASKRIGDFFGLGGSSPPADIVLHEGDSVKFGEMTLKVMHSPGHSRGSVSLLGEKEVFTGDTLFSGSIGRTDFPESSQTDMWLSLKKLASLSDQLVVYPGHGPVTKLGLEKRSNPFLQRL